jgi:AcrR family transcriptional regulator
MNATSDSLQLDTRECLIGAALACFAKYGYEATSIRLVASQAGKNSSLISYYFNNKEGLYREVFKRVLTQFRIETGLGGALPLDQARGEAEDPRTQLRNLVRRFLQEIEAHLHSTDPLREAAARLFLSEINAPKEEVKDLLKERMQPRVQELRACILAIRPDLSAADVDFWGITLHGCCIAHALKYGINQLVWTSADPALPLDELADRLADFALNGLLHR